jgi:NADH-quinone oxidoreductase subunit A
MNAYVPILVLGAIAVAFAVFSVAVASVVGPKRRNRAKLEAYECGIEPTPQSATGRAGGQRIPVKYYLTAMLFIIFDIEIVFLYPYVVARAELGAYAFFEILAFSVVFFAAIVYVVAKGGLDWGPIRRLRGLSPAISAERTTASTIRRVGADGRRVEQPEEAA